MLGVVILCLSMMSNSSQTAAAFVFYFLLTQILHWAQLKALWELVSLKLWSRAGTISLKCMKVPSSILTTGSSR